MQRKQESVLIHSYLKCDYHQVRRNSKSGEEGTSRASTLRAWNHKSRAVSREILFMTLYCAHTPTCSVFGHSATWRKECEDAAAK